MKNILQKIIVHSHERELPQVVPRLIDLPVYTFPVRKAHVLMGMRRSGKTWLLYQDMLQKIKKSIKREKLLYLNFEDDRLLGFTAKDFNSILDAYFTLYPKLIDDEEVTFYFDEIHLIDGWEKFIRRLLDQERMQIFVTGSSAKMLSKEIATTLRGRASDQEVFPFNFREYLRFQDIDNDSTHTKKTQMLIKHHSHYYLQHGGFPETLFIAPSLHRDLLQDYVNTVIFRDVIDRYQLSNPHIVKLFLFHCLQNSATTLSVTKIYNTFKSLGETVGKNSLYEYLDYFEDAYAIFTVPIFSLSLKKRQVNPKKIYTIDPGIIYAYTVKPQFEIGPSLENAVFIELRRRSRDIFYYKTVNDKEIDFVVMTSIGKLELYQVCADLSSQLTRQRECSALIEASDELETDSLTLVTLEHQEIISINNKIIHCIPFWQWAK